MSADANLKRYKVSLIVLVLLAAAFFSGFYFGGNGSAPAKAPLAGDLSGTSSAADLSQFWQVWNLLDQKFVATHKNETTPTVQDKIYGAIEGLTDAYGDPYTVFMPPQASAEFESDVSGSFEGVGMELGMKDTSIVVIAPLKDTPADEAGVKSGDIILAIDGTSTAGMSVDEAVDLIRGKAGTAVDLSIGRDGAKSPLDFKITRQVINVPSVDTETKGDVFVIHLYNFYEPADSEFTDALRQFALSGKTKLVLDLRGNPGGYLDSAVDIASWFLPLGDVVVREDFGDGSPEQVYRSRGYSAPFDGKLDMVVLVDGGSASAAEILSGALSEQGVAKLVGVQTFGKGSVQQLIDIPPDASLKITIAKWLTPNGVSISESGLTPDVVVPLSEDDLKAGRDPQMDAAIGILDGTK